MKLLNNEYKEILTEYLYVDDCINIIDSFLEYSYDDLNTCEKKIIKKLYRNDFYDDDLMNNDCKINYIRNNYFINGEMIKGNEWNQCLCGRPLKNYYYLKHKKNNSHNRIIGDTCKSNFYFNTLTLKEIKKPKENKIKIKPTLTFKKKTIYIEENNNLDINTDNTIYYNIKDAIYLDNKYKKHSFLLEDPDLVFINNNFKLTYNKDKIKKYEKNSISVYKNKKTYISGYNNYLKTPYIKGFKYDLKFKLNTNGHLIFINKS